MARGRPKKVVPEVSQPVLIALSGPKGAGKTTVAKMVNPTEIITFAKPLKTLAKELFGLTDEQVNGKLKEVPFDEPKILTEIQARKIVRYMANELIALRNQGNSISFSAHAISVNKIMRGPFFSPRDLMQKLGTEIMQYIYKPFSCEVALIPFKDKPGIYVVDDMRFPLENETGRNLFKFYYPVRIRGRNEEVKDGHASENAWKSIKFFAEIDNSGSVDDLKLRAVEVFAHIQTDIKLRLEKGEK